MSNIVILGASGSIGTQTLDVIKKYKNTLELQGISLGNNVNYLDIYLKDYPNLKYVCLKNKKDYDIFIKKYKDITFYYGDEGLIKLIENSNADIVVNALTGFVGFLPSIRTLELNKILCLANKESLVVGGEFINKLLNEGHGKLYPIDSEHVAIAKCLFNKNKEDIDKIIITASGGPFFNLDKDKFKDITPKDALNHPTWKMGRKITIDSSTMMNKAFEIVEAHYLFDVPSEKIEPIVDRKSHVHSMVKFKNGDYYLNVGPSDMRIPIEYALTFGKCDKEKFPDVEINTFDQYTFFNLDKEKFPLINYGYEIIKRKGNFGAIINAANEDLVYRFLNGDINYIDIKRIIDKIVKVYPYIANPNIEDIIKTDKDVRALVKEIIESKNYD